MIATLVDRLGQMVVNAFAVAGGGLVGWLASAGLIWAVGRFVFHRPVSRLIRQVVNTLSGAGTAFLMVVLVFGGEGGWGLGHGTGLGGQSLGLAEIAADAAAKPTALALEPPPAPLVAAERLRVTLLGGKRVHHGAFYQLDGERVARTLRDLQESIRARRTTGAVSGLELLIYDNSVARNSPAVRDLEAWASEVQLSVTVVTVPGELP